MQPQGPDTPQPTPNPTPTPTPTPQDTPPPQAPTIPPFNPQGDAAPATPAPGAHAGGVQHGAMPGASTPTPAKKPPMALIGAILGGLVLIGAAVWAYFTFFTGIPLEAYNADNYTVKVPVGYEKNEQDEGILFKEKGDETTASSVFAYYADFPTKLSSSQLSTVRSTFKSSIESTIDNFTSSTHTISDIKIEDTTFKGAEAIKITAKAKSSSSEGLIKVIAVVSDERIYMVGVAADGGDQALISSADTIIDSFTLK